MERNAQLDYFLHKTGPLNCTKKEVLYNMMSCTSDHHPVKIILSMDISEKAIEHKNDTNQINPNIKWDKVDQDLCIAMINERWKKSQAHGAWISFPPPPFSLLPPFFQNFHINHSFFKIFIIIRFFFIWQYQ